MLISTLESYWSLSIVGLVTVSASDIILNLYLKSAINNKHSFNSIITILKKQKLFEEPDQLQFLAQN